jgi:hypothetical protein
MIKHFAFATVAAFALSGAAQAKTVPGLSGSYLYSGSETCPSGGGTVHQMSGTLSFDPETGKAKMDVYAVTGDKPEILRIKSTQDYSNDTTFLTLGAVQYHITYGTVQSGVAVTASIIGLNNDQAVCGWQATLSAR